MKAWITKYSLTKGIQLWEGGVSESCETMFCAGGRYAHGNDWHRTEAAAIARAEKMRADKILGLRKQIAKLEAMRFGTGK